MKYKNDWLLDNIQKFQKEATTYLESALFQALTQQVVEQKKRLEQAENELDGNLWDTKNW